MSRIPGSMVFGIALSIFASQALALPTVSRRCVSVKTAGGTFVVLSISGVGFGTAGSLPPTTYVDILAGTGWMQVPAGDSAIKMWRDDQIVVELAGSEHPRGARVVVAGAVSRSSRVRRYELTLFDTKNAAFEYDPGILRTGPDGRLWIHGEGYLNHLLFDGATDSLVPIYYPHPTPDPPNRAPFFNSCLFFGCGWSGYMTLGEGMTVDEYGRAWFSQGGGFPYLAPPESSPNHSRLAMFDPRTETVRLYYVPGDQNLVSGITWDRKRKRIWYVNQPLAPVTARLTSFDPEAVPFREFPNYLSVPSVTSFNYITSDTCDPAAGGVKVCSNNGERECLTNYDCVGVEHVCPRPALGQPESSVNDASCFHEYPLEGVLAAFGLAVGSDGVFFANGGNAKEYEYNLPGGGYGSRSIGLLDPASGSVRYLPLPSNPNGGPSYPYELYMAKNGDVVVSLTGSSAVARFRPRSLSSDPNGCETLVPTAPGANCAISDPVGTPDPVAACENLCVTVHYDTAAWTECTGPACTEPFVWNKVGYDAIALDGNRTIWNSRGYVRFRGSGVEVVYFPPLSIHYPSPNLADPPDCPTILAYPLGGIGERVTFDNHRDEVWGKSACSFRLHRLRRD